MTPPLLPTHGDDCGPAQIGDFAAGTGTDNGTGAAQLKAPSNMEIVARDMLHAASSPPDEVSDWNQSTWALLNEGATPSALRGRLPRLDIPPSMVQGTPSETSESRYPSSNRQYGEGGYENLVHPLHLHRASGNHLYSFVEDAMDWSDAPSHASGLDGNPAAQRLASTVASWDPDRPCRPNPNSSHDMAFLLAAWRVEYEVGRVTNPIAADVMNIRELPRPFIVSGLDVAEGSCDMQGVRWSQFGTHIADVQEIRSRYHRHPQIRQYGVPPDALRLPSTQRTFSFQQTNMEARPWIEHYQLRNLVATTSHNDVHYVSRQKVMSIGPLDPVPSCVMDLSTSSDPFQAASDFHITSLAAAGPALIAGGYRGEYAIQDLTSEYGTEPVTGYISDDRLASTNHIHVFNSRFNGAPHAAFCSNDGYLRSMDITSGRIVSSIRYDDVMNCSATSTNGRLRVLTGDFDGALIVDSDSGRVLLQASGGSLGHGFACAWADNDIHVATAGQDCQVLIWDARNWAAPLATIATENAYPTSLQFSPVGGGAPVLVVAEAADTVSVVNARTYASKQTIEFFGDTAGTAISADGSQLTIANGDRNLGGVMTFERRDFGAETNGHGSGRSRRRISSQRSDWLQECELEFHPRVRLDAKARRRRGLNLDDMLF